MQGRRAALVAFGLFLACLLGELSLRIVPFERLKYEARYGHFSGNAVARFLEYDPVLTFRNRRNARFPDAGVTIDRFGLRGPEIEFEKRPGRVRVLCMGDSCTFGGARPYPEILQEILDRRHGPGKFEVLNAGVIGYTALHGLEWLERELLELRPDVVTVYFGWNDLWREKDSAIRDWFRRRLEDGDEPLLRSRLLDASERLAALAKNRFWPERAPIQIPPERYRRILERFVELGRERGFRTVLVTAPSGFRDDETPQWLVERGFVAPGDSAPRLRRQYNEIVAEVARASGVPLADCAAAFERAGAPSFFDRPDEDPIHPNDRGYTLIAETIAATDPFR
jgi:lysophospholipase L1-like esterase